VWLGTTLALVLGTGLQLLRGPGVPVWRAVFGEDGGIFLTEAVASRGWGSLFTPYQGYLQFISRLMAEAVAELPLRAAAVVLAGASAALVSLLSLFVYRASASLLHDRWARLAVAVAPVVLPAGFETNANVTNLHWYLDYACFWALAAPLQRRWFVVAGTAVVAVAVLSDPLAGLFLPLGLWRAWRTTGLTITRGGHLERAPRPIRRAELAAPAALVVGLVLQLLLGLSQQQPGRFRASQWTDLPSIYGLRVAGSFLLGDRYLPGLFGHLGTAFALGCLAVVSGGVVVALRRRESRPLVSLAVGYSVVWLVIPLMLRGTDTFLNRDATTLQGTRYILNPILLLIVGFAAWLDSSPADHEKPPTRASLTIRTVLHDPRTSVTLAFGIITVLSWSIPSQRVDGPVWPDSLRAAAQRCANSGQLPREVGRSAEAPWGLPAGPSDVLVPVSPGGLRPPWSLVAPCRRL
jgi:hypothetical protein